MNLPLPNQEEIHAAIIVALSEHCWEEIEHASPNAEYLKEFNAAVEHIAPLVSPAMLRILENAPFHLGQRFGESMFQLGVQIGRNPYALLPKVPPTGECQP